ncbi:hypothetical protein [Streptomyces sp. NPDC096132]|uniref:hypothetical protein n=1 Tax=Streptomyces sp. NPDC096132 TaxID=3366075 RepID=UPI00381C1E21
MKRPGPLLTLLAGLVLAVFLLALNATTGTPGGTNASSSRQERSPSPAPTRSSGSPGPTATASATPPPNADYAGRTDDDSAAIALSLRDGKAIAYFCDGRTKESWLKGDVEDDGTLRLTGKNGARLDGTLKEGKVIRGTVDVAGAHHGFTADKAKKPSGLYRATATVRSATIDAGWIVLKDGTQVGVLTRDGLASPAPGFDPETGAVTVDGERLTARPATP